MLAASERDLDRCRTPKFQEPDLILSTSRALGSVENADVHKMWSGVLLGRLREHLIPESVLLENPEELKIYPYFRALGSSLRFVNNC